MKTEIPLEVKICHNASLESSGAKLKPILSILVKNYPYYGIDIN